jgi:hypothetical protein
MKRPSEHTLIIILILLLAFVAIINMVMISSLAGGWGWNLSQAGLPPRGSVVWGN